MRKPKWHIRLSRDALLMLGGFLGILHETLWQHGPERPSLLIVFAAMIGLPAFLRRDEL